MKQTEKRLKYLGSLDLYPGDIVEESDGELGLVRRDGLIRWARSGRVTSDIGHRARWVGSL